MMRCRTTVLRYIILLSLTMMLGACHSSRRAVATAVPSTKTENPVVVLPPDMADNMRSDQQLLVEEALKWIGTPYRYGGTERSGTDCSGMTMRVYGTALGIKLPRSSREQQQFCKSIKKSALDAGDLVFFSTGRDKTRVSHVGMYIGENKFIHASGSRGVIVSDLNERYYAVNYHSAGHVARAADSVKRSKNGKETARNQEPKPSSASSAPQAKNEITLDRFLELNRRQNQIDEVIEAKIDSIYSSFLE